MTAEEKQGIHEEVWRLIAAGSLGELSSSDFQLDLFEFAKDLPVPVLDEIIEDVKQEHEYQRARLSRET